MSNAERLLGVVMDPIEGIHPKKDTTLAMLVAAQKRGWRVIYFRQQDLSVAGGTAIGRGRELKASLDPYKWFEYAKPWNGELHALSALLMRKDPPFNMEYIYTTYILQLAQDRGLLVVNRPSSLREINEKTYTAWFPQCTPPNLITRSREDLLAFLAEHRKIVFKPLDGMGGRSIFVVAEGDPNTNVIIETITDYGTKYTIAQRYIPEIAQGDKRLLLIEGRPVDYALARVPAPGESRGNLVAGARPEGRELTARDRWICDQVGPVLVEKGVLFAGLDVIGDYLTEINVTSPTGVRELEKEYGIDIAAIFIAAIEKRIG
jgi:glutathione synthase